ncbi:MAG: hypothetical protein EAX95_16630 [Candidatus Thorarchaeota archaeon]|nr:hypothetical protein [Candidatus Thorarchaeota archaeon]
MRRFLISFKAFPIRLEDVKEGTNALEVVTASRCVNVGLFLSGDMRRDVEVSILIGKSDNLGVISFPGWQLKRVSPDERSISYFLLKGFGELSRLKRGEKMEMPNGIILRATELETLLEEWDSSKMFIAVADANRETVQESPENGIYIFETVIGVLNCDGLGLQPIWKAAHPERFILDVNLAQDRKHRFIEKSS